jgi:cytochrome P450
VNASAVAGNVVRRRDRLPPGPRRTPRSLLNFRRDALGWLRELPRYGDFVHFRVIGNRSHYLIVDPEATRHFLVADHRRVTKGASMQQARRLIGNGLLTSEAELHQKQRRILQPAFVQPKVEAYGDRMLEVIETTEGSWRAGDVLDVHTEMYRLTLQVIGHSLISAELGQRADTLDEALRETSGGRIA